MLVDDEGDRFEGTKITQRHSGQPHQRQREQDRVGIYSNSAEDRIAKGSSLVVQQLGKDSVVSRQRVAPYEEKLVVHPSVETCAPA